MSVPASKAKAARVLVTGGAGFIGAHLCEKLLANGHSVAVLDNFDAFYDPAIKRENVARCQGLGDFRCVEGDIRDAQCVQELMSQHHPEIIVHLAAKAGVRPSLDDPSGFADVNINGTLVLLEAARKFSVKKFVFGSSSSVYGNNAKVPFAETDNVDFPISPYAATKKAGELLCHTYSHLHDMDMVCLRFFTVYGPRQRPDLAIHKFARLIDSGKPIPVFGDGSMQRDYTYVDDITQGIMAAMNRCWGYEIYNLGESCPIRLDALIIAIEKALGKKAVIHRMAAQPGDVQRTYADIDKARSELGYEPKTSIAEGLEKFVAWLKAQRKERKRDHGVS